MPSEQRESVSALWLATAILIGGALPLMIVGRAVTSTWLILGIVIGLLAMGRTALKLDGWLPMLRSKVTWGLGAVFGTFALSAAFSIVPGHSWGQWGQLLLIAVLGFLLFRVMMEMPTKAVRTALDTLAILTVALAGYLLVDAGLNPDRGEFALGGVVRNSQERFNFMSSVLAVLSPFVWVWLLRMQRDKKLKTWLAFGLGAMVFIALIVANGRAGWLGAGASMLVFAGLLWHFHGLRLNWRWVTAFAGVAVAAFAAYMASRGVDYALHRMDFSDFEQAGSGRLPIWTFAFSHMFDNPLTGIGIHAFRFLPPPEFHINSQMHPHNFVIQLLLEVGILGTLAVFGFIYAMFRSLWRYAQLTLYSAAGLASLVAFFTASLANTSIYQARWLVFMMVAFALAVRLCRAQKNTTGE